MAALMNHDADALTGSHAHEELGIEADLQASGPCSAMCVVPHKLHAEEDVGEEGTVRFLEQADLGLVQRFGKFGIACVVHGFLCIEGR